MSYFMMYLFVMLDSIKSTFEFITVLITIAFFITAFITFTLYDDRKMEIVHKGVKIIKYMLGLFFICITISTFVPNTKQMAAIYLIPTVANNKDIQELFGTSLNIVKEQAKLYLEELYEKKK